MLAYFDSRLASLTGHPGTSSLEVGAADTEASALAVAAVDPSGAQLAAVDRAADRALAAPDPLCGLRDRQELGRRRGIAGNVERELFFHGVLRF